MKLIDRGTGTPVVLVPGIQGRWEWMGPAVDALARRCRVITFSLADEPTSGAPFDERAGFDAYVQQVGAAMDQAGLGRATVCGISYGGLIAATFAARHPERTTAVALASAIPPSWRPDRRVRFLMRAPRLLSPLFCIGSLRLLSEMAAAGGGVLPGVWFGIRHVATVLRHIFSPVLMARRVRLIETIDLEPELERLDRPALVITGEPGLDRVVPVEATLDYLRLWPHAVSATIERTGHLGVITRPDEFARLVADHASRAIAGTEDRRRLG